MKKISIPSSLRRSQRGVGVIEVGLALVVFSAAVAFGLSQYWRFEDGRRAENQASVMELIRNAAETLLMEHYTDYQAGQPITRNGVTLPFGAGLGEALSPTVAQLNTMALGLNNASETPFYKTLSNGGYNIGIQRVPAGCEASPNGVECNITGLICFDQPVADPRRPGETMDSYAIGKMLDRLGANGGASVLEDGSTVFGFGGAWEVDNPIAGQPAGVVCSRFGFGSAGFGNFLRVRDTRDPQFQNNVSVAGGVNIQRTVNNGDACTVDETGLIVQGVLNGNALLFQCNGTVFAPLTGLTYASEGASCVGGTEDGFALDEVTGIHLTCSDGMWVRQEGRGVLNASYYQHGSVVPTPTCPVGHQPAAVVAAVSASNIIGINNPGNNTGSFQASINAAWQVSITGSDGISVAGNSALALILTSCQRV